MPAYRSHALLFAFLFALALAATACAGGSAQPATAADVDAMCRSYARGNNPDVHPPKLLSGEQPPPPAGGATSGYACVRVTINDSGHVVEPMVVKTDNQDFAQAFVRALGDWRYEPATRGTAKVPYHTVLTARFPPA